MKKHSTVHSRSEFDPLEVSRSTVQNHSHPEKEDCYGSLVFITGIASSQNEQMYCVSTNHGFSTYARKGESELSLSSEIRSKMFEVG
jgi:hypothetical protein